MIKLNFNVNIPALKDALQARVLTVQKKLAFDLVAGVVTMTPVDTGRAKGNWFVTLTAPVVTYDWNLKDKEGMETITAGQQAAEALQTYGAIYLTNNLPYIEALEKGHSGQAPAGMVRVSLDRVTAGLR